MAIEKPTITKGELKSDACQTDDILQVFYYVFGEMLKQRETQGSSVANILISSKATNGWVEMGWLAEAGHKSDTPDAPYLFFPYWINLPRLTESGDAWDFDNQVRWASSTMWENLYNYYDDREFGPDLANLRGEVDYIIPQQEQFRVFFMNDVDFDIVEMIV